MLWGFPRGILPAVRCTSMPHFAYQRASRPPPYGSRVMATALITLLPLRDRFGRTIAKRGEILVRRTKVSRALMVTVFSSMVFNPRPPHRATLGAPTTVVLNIHILKKGPGCCILMGVALMRRRKSARSQGETAVLAGCNARGLRGPVPPGPGSIELRLYGVLGSSPKKL
jgi:hypothetical protein